VSTSASQSKLNSVLLPALGKPIIPIRSTLVIYQTYLDRTTDRAGRATFSQHAHCDIIDDPSLYGRG
jgi:hypothetical protein